MLVISNVILVFVNAMHFWTHFKCPRINCRYAFSIKFSSSDDNKFGVFPVLFSIYSSFQLFLSILITLSYIYDVQNNMIYQYDGDNSWNSMELIPQILLYPFGKKGQFTYFRKQRQFTLNTPINNILSIQNTNILITISLCILFLIYTLEVFMDWYRYYTVYVAHKYLKNFSFCIVFKYYMIYVFILILVILVSLLLQHYVGILMVIIHFSFSIYCSNQQSKILYKSTNLSFDKQQVKLLMAPLYTTRNYANLSSISSSIFLLILIISNTLNSIIYYPIFSCLTTSLLSLMFIRNRLFVCSCFNIYKRCCPYFKKMDIKHVHTKQALKTPIPQKDDDDIDNLADLQSDKDGSSGLLEKQSSNSPKVIVTKQDIVSDLVVDINNNDNNNDNNNNNSSSPIMIEMEQIKENEVENTMVIHSNLMSVQSSLPSIISALTANNVTQTEVDLYGTENIQQPGSPHNTPTLNALHNSSKASVLIIPNVNSTLNRVTSPVSNNNNITPISRFDNKNPFDITYITAMDSSQTRLKTVGSITKENTYIRKHTDSNSMQFTYTAPTKVIDSVYADDDLFDYENVKTPQQCISTYGDGKPDDEKRKKMNIVRIQKEYYNDDISQTGVPSQRPTTEKNMKTFFVNTDNNNNNNNNCNVIDEGDEFKRQISTHSQQSHLDVNDLEQHLNLLRILKSQGLLKNPEDLLRSHQKLNARQIQSNKTNNNKFRKQLPTLKGKLSLSLSLMANDSKQNIHIDTNKINANNIQTNKKDLD